MSNFLDNPDPCCLWTRTECVQWRSDKIDDYRAGLRAQYPTRSEEAIDREIGMLFTSRFRIETPTGNSVIVTAEGIQRLENTPTALYESSRVDIERGIGGIIGQSLEGVTSYDVSGPEKRGGPCNSQGVAFSHYRDCGPRYAVSPTPTPAALNTQLGAFLSVLDAVPDGNEKACEDVVTSAEYLAIPVDDRPIADRMHRLRGWLPDFQTVVDIGAV